RAVSGRSLQLGVTTAACGAEPDRVRAAPFRVGPFSGWIDDWSLGAVGAVSDGTTYVSFTSGLPADELATVLASLRPFDPAGGPWASRRR
ncbi:MAG: hypothetical protein ACRDZ0_11085, partial [Acidimicrobiales bacterium]